MSVHKQSNEEEDTANTTVPIISTIVLCEKNNTANTSGVKVGLQLINKYLQIINIPL